MRRQSAISILLVSSLIFLTLGNIIFASSENWVEVIRFTQEGDNYPADLLFILEESVSVGFSFVGSSSRGKERERLNFNPKTKYYDLFDDDCTN